MSALRQSKALYYANERIARAWAPYPKRSFRVFRRQQARLRRLIRAKNRSDAGAHDRWAWAAWLATVQEAL